MGLIYKITNTKNNKIYIGFTTRTIEERVIEEHFNPSEKTNAHLKNAIKKYGLENFTYETIVEGDFSKKALSELEKHYVWLYNAWIPDYGYNKTKGGEDPPRKIWTDADREDYRIRFSGENSPMYGVKIKQEWKDKMMRSDYQQNRKIKFYILNNKLEILGEFNNLQSGADFIGCNRKSTIALPLTNKCKTLYGYVIVYKEKLEEKLEEIKADKYYFKNKSNKEIRIVNIDTKESFIFNSINKCSKFLEVSLYFVYKSINKKPLKGYIVEHLD